MRLLKFSSHGDLSLTKDLDENIPSYAILSHTWGADDDEVTFDDIKNGSSKSKTSGYTKIQFCGEQARRDGLEYFWVDTCCINKANYTELSEAITSMFRWYRNAAKCYVYLPDVSTTGGDGTGQTQRSWESTFRNSRWFTRGWTLQELLAPKLVQFFSKEEELLGDKKLLEKQIHEITGIPLTALRGSPLSEFGVDERLQWAENRKTQKEEDKAYCLLGIFNVFLPLIYGERENAFVRLKAEIDRHSKKSQNLPSILQIKAEKMNHTADTSTISEIASKTDSMIDENASYVVNQLTSVFKNLFLEDKAHATSAIKLLTKAHTEQREMLKKVLDRLLEPKVTKLPKYHVKRIQAKQYTLKRGVRSLKVVSSRATEDHGAKSTLENCKHEIMAHDSHWNTDSLRALILLVITGSYANPSSKRFLSKLWLCAQTDPILAILLLITGVFLQRCLTHIPAQISWLTDTSVAFEDAFGVEIRIPFHHCERFEFFQGYLEYYFRDRPGSQWVIQRRYRLFLGSIRDREVDRISWPKVVKPKMRMMMAMQLVSLETHCVKCSQLLTESHDQTYLCMSCNQVYGVSSSLGIQSSVEDDEANDHRDKARSASPTETDERELGGQEWRILEESISTARVKGENPGPFLVSEAESYPSEPDLEVKLFKNMTLKVDLRARKSLDTLSNVLESQDGDVTPRFQYQEDADLLCPFQILDCDRVFTDVVTFKMHVFSHFRGHELPPSASCFLCDNKYFQRPEDDQALAWNTMLSHMVHEHFRIGRQLATVRTDFSLMRWMYRRRIINDHQFKKTQIIPTPILLPRASNRRGENVNTVEVPRAPSPSPPAAILAHLNPPIGYRHEPFILNAGRRSERRRLDTTRTMVRARRYM